MLKVGTLEGAGFVSDTSWILPESFEAFVNQQIRVVGTKGVSECDSQDGGSRSCLNPVETATYYNDSNGETTGNYRRKIARGYRIESIEDFVHNVAFLKNGRASTKCPAAGHPARMDSRWRGLPWRSTRAQRPARSFD